MVAVPPCCVLLELARVNARGGRYDGRTLPVPLTLALAPLVLALVLAIQFTFALGCAITGVPGVEIPLTARSSPPSRSHRYTRPSSDPPAMRLHEGETKAHRMMFLDVFWWPV